MPVDAGALARSLLDNMPVAEPTPGPLADPGDMDAPPGALDGLLDAPEEFDDPFEFEEDPPLLAGARGSPLAFPPSAFVSLSILANCAFGTLLGVLGAEPPELSAIFPGVTETEFRIDPLAPGKPNSTAPRKVTTLDFCVP